MPSEFTPHSHRMIDIVGLSNELKVNNARVVEFEKRVNTFDTKLSYLENKVNTLENKIKPTSEILFASNQVLETSSNEDGSLTKVCCIKIPANTFSTSSKGNLKLSLKGLWDYFSFDSDIYLLALSLSDTPWDTDSTRLPIYFNFQGNNPGKWELLLDIETKLNNQPAVTVGGTFLWDAPPLPKGSCSVKDTFNLIAVDINQDTYVSIFTRTNIGRPITKFAINNALLEKYPDFDEYPDFGEYIPK